MSRSPIVAIVSCSLNTASRSHRLALAAATAIQAIGAEADVIDLKEWDLPLCDGGGSFNHPSVKPLSAKLAAAAAILVASPVYNYDLNAAAKNLVEMTGAAWKEKPVGFLCAAGGERSYMSPIGFANSLMLDFRSLIIPRFVYCTKADFDADGTLGASLHERVDQLGRAAVDLARGLDWVRSSTSSRAIRT